MGLGEKLNPRGCRAVQCTPAHGGMRESLLPSPASSSSLSSKSCLCSSVW